MQPPSDHEVEEADEDRSLIRWMLSLEPGERLDFLQQHVNAILEIRERNETAWISEGS